MPSPCFMGHTEMQLGRRKSKQAHSPKHCVTGQAKPCSQAGGGGSEESQPPGMDKFDLTSTQLLSCSLSFTAAPAQGSCFTNLKQTRAGLERCEVCRSRAQNPSACFLSHHFQLEQGKGDDPELSSPMLTKHSATMSMGMLGIVTRGFGDGRRKKASLGPWHGDLRTAGLWWVQAHGQHYETGPSSPQRSSGTAALQVRVSGVLGTAQCRATLQPGYLLHT